MTDQIKQGWAWPGNAKKAHYFQSCRSLCGRWAFFGELEQGGPEATSNDCAPCRRKLEALRRTEASDG